MINPIRLCNDLFADPALSDINLRGFCEDFLIRLSNNNPGGIYVTLIADTTTKYTAYYGKMVGIGNQEHIQEGLTITMNNSLQLVIDKIKQLQGLIIFKFGESSAVYQQFFPQGLEPYTRVRLIDAPTTFDEFVTAATTNLTADYPLEVTAITNLVAAFKTARTAQENAFSLVDNLITGKHEDRTLLTTQLTFNFLTIDSNNIGMPDRFDDYYDPAYLPITRDTNAPVVKEGTVAMGVILNIDLSDITNGNTVFKLKNPGTSNLRYYFSPTLGGQPANTFTDVQPGDTIDKTATELGLSDVNIFFTVHNVGATPGSYRVEIEV